MSFVPTKLYCDSYFPNTETSLTMGNGHTQFAGLSDMTYSWVVDTSNNLVLNGQASGPSPAIQPILIAPNGDVSIPSLDVSGAGVLSVSSANGSGLTCTGTNNVALASNLVAGANITLTPSTTNTSITISATGGGSGGVSSVSSGNGSGITCTGTSTVALTSNLVAGSGITLTPSTTNSSISISASGSGSAPLTGLVNLDASGQYVLSRTGVSAGSIVLCSYTYNVVAPAGVCWANPSTNQIDFTGTPFAQIMYAVYT